MSKKGGMAGALVALGILFIALVAGAVFSVNALGPSIRVDETLGNSCVHSVPNQSTVNCKAAYNDLLRQYNADYARWSLTQRGRAQAWQSISSVVFFAASLGVLSAGLIFTYLEFRRPVDKPITFKAGSAGIEISSELAGIVVLVISLIFSYLYMDRAFPITEIGAQQTVVQSSKADATP
jgi:hypothetical protein